MIVWVLKLFGFPILRVEQTAYQLFSDEEEDDSAVGGGSAHNFTLAAPYVDERYEPWEEDRFGFR